MGCSRELFKRRTQFWPVTFLAPDLNKRSWRHWFKGKLPENYGYHSQGDGFPADSFQPPLGRSASCPLALGNTERDADAAAAADAQIADPHDPFTP